MVGFIGQSGMFVVEVTNAEEMEAACEALLEYPELYTEPLSEKSIVVAPQPGAEEKFRLAEIYFQMNFVQKNQNLCVVCRKHIEETGEGEAFCGHLTFTRRK